MKVEKIVSLYSWRDAKPTQAHQYILPAMIKQVDELAHRRRRVLKILDLGCGNGSVAAVLNQMGHAVTAIDASPDGIEIARQAYPGIDFRLGSLDEDFTVWAHEPVDLVISVEVIEHLYNPGSLIEQSFSILRKGGHLILTTPYHGYLKNLILTLTNGWDRHFSVNRDGGHIKFFSRRTLSRMATEAGFQDLCFRGLGRFPGVWKSMMLVAEK